MTSKPDANRAEMVRRRRELRRSSTPAERLLWGALRNRRLAGLKFRRQYGIGRYIVDFVCLEARLVVEVDGESHEHRGEQDMARQRWLEDKGFRVLRVSNEEVLRDLETVLQGIERFARGGAARPRIEDR